MDAFAAGTDEGAAQEEVRGAERSQGEVPGLRDEKLSTGEQTPGSGSEAGSRGVQAEEEGSQQGIWARRGSRQTMVIKSRRKSLPLMLERWRDGIGSDEPAHEDEDAPGAAEGFAAAAAHAIMRGSSPKAAKLRDTSLGSPRTAQDLAREAAFAAPGGSIGSSRLEEDGRLQSRKKPASGSFNADGNRPVRASFRQTRLSAGIPELGVVQLEQLAQGLHAHELRDDAQTSPPPAVAPLMNDHDSASGSGSSVSDPHLHMHIPFGSEATGTSAGRRSNKSRATSRRSREGGPRRTRHARGNRYSAWEAHTHVPNIKLSWSLTMERSNWEALGLKFYDALLAAFPELHETSLRKGDKVEVVKKLSDMLYTIVSASDSPTELRERLQALAPMHLKKGVTDAHMAPMGKIVVGIVEDVLGKDFTPDFRAAWDWLWAWISGVMSETLLDARLESDALSQSWDLACDRFTDDEIGGLLCDSLTALAPNLKSGIFPIPRQILAPRFFEMMSTLRSFYNDHDRMKEQVTWLAMRHMQYKARPEHVSTFGQSLIAALEEAVGEDDWTPAMGKAWLDLWNETCAIMMEIIEEAQMFGADAQGLWALLKGACTPKVFGESLRKDLLLHGAIAETFQAADTWKSKAQVARLLRAYFNSWLEGSKDRKFRRSRSESVGGRRDSVFDSVLLSETESQEDPEENFDVTSFKKGNVKVTHKGHGINENIIGRLKDDSPECLGQTIWDLLTSGLDLLWEPEMQNEKLMTRAKQLHEWGLRERDLDVLGLAVSTTLRRKLGTEYTAHRQESWTWFWRTLREPLGRMLLDSERDMAAVLRESWRVIQSVTTTEHLAELFFNELNIVAPHVIHLFKLPKKMQSIRLHSICELLIKFFECPDVFFARFKLLAIRHISYGVRADMTKPFGAALVTAIQKAVGDKLDPSLEHAWSDLWTRASTCVTRSLAIASNLVVVALVQGDVAKLKEALDCAPRCERWMWLLRVKINGEAISPLCWAIRDGRFSMAQFMLDDVLMIRADRESYFFGCQALWETHPTIVSVLAKEAPELLETLLDGHLWHSSSVEEGMVRVNYFIANLYGDPDKYNEVWESPLATLVLEGEPDIFTHPMVKKLLELKWTHFARFYFLCKMVWFSALLLLFMICSVLRASDCSFFHLRAALGLASLASLASMLNLATSQHLRSQSARIQLFLPGLKLPVPFFLANLWNLSRFCSCALLVITTLLDPCLHSSASLNAAPDSACAPPDSLKPDALLDDGSVPDAVGLMDGEYGYKALTAVVAILLWLQLVQAFSISTKMAAFSYTIGIMFQDVLHNLVVIAIFLLAFASALTVIDEKPMLSNFSGWTLLLMREVLSLDHDDLDQTSNFGGLLLFMFSILTTVGMLNMLIAQLSLAYESMADHKVGFALKHRAAICVDIESMLSLAERRKLYASLGFDKPVPFGNGDDGPCGGIQVFEAAKSVRGDPRYRPDRIIRFTEFEASPRDPWPQHQFPQDDGGSQDGEERGAFEGGQTHGVTTFKSFPPGSQPPDRKSVV